MPDAIQLTATFVFVVCTIAMVQPSFVVLPGITQIRPVVPASEAVAYPTTT